LSSPKVKDARAGWNVSTNPRTDDKSGAPEVGVERKRLEDLALPHQRERSAVREGEDLVLVADEDSPAVIAQAGIDLGDLQQVAGLDAV
jgi:hypothetical protein